MFKKLFLSATTATYLLSSTQYNEIKFEGLTQISDNMALETIELSNKKNISETDIDNAIKKLFKYNYFDDIYVQEIDNNLIFKLKEKPFIVNIEMEGYKTRDDDLKTLYATMGIKKGTMYTPEKLNSAKKALLLALQREGYINSVVEVDKEYLTDQTLKIKFNVNKGEDIIVKNITYDGLKSLEISDLEAVLANKEEDCCFTWFFGQNDGKMSFEQLDYDGLRIKDLYMQNGFIDATVSKAFSKIDFNTNTADIQYKIAEGAKYKVNDIIIYLDENITKVDPIYEQLKLEKGDIFNIANLRKDQEKIKNIVADKGYAFAQVNFDIRKDPEKQTAQIIYNVIPGKKVYINDVIISGNSRTLDRVIRRDIYLAHEDLYSLTDYKDSLNKLKRTGFFENVRIDRRRISEDKMDLIVEVTEAPTGNLILGGGYGSYDGWMINASVNDKNIFGSGLNLGFSLDYSSKKQNYTLSLSNPAIRDSIYSGSVNVHRDESIITSSDTTYGDKTTIEQGFGAGIGRSLSRHSRVGLNYGYEAVDVSYDIGSEYDNNYIISSLTPYINYNNTDDYFIPRSGMMAGSSLKYAGVGGDAKYTLSSTYFKYFYGLEDAIDYDIILRYKNSLKLLKDNGNIPDGTTFYLGGPTSLRGYESYAFQPEDSDHPYSKYFTNTFEISFPLIPSAKMRWALFYDYGMIGADSFSEVKRAGNGAVISWYSPVGPLQFIFSRPVNAKDGDKTSTFEFSLGSKF